MASKKAKSKPTTSQEVQPQLHRVKSSSYSQNDLRLTSYQDIEMMLNEHPTDPQLLRVSDMRNPLKRSWGPHQMTVSTNVHLEMKPSILSISNLKQQDYSGFVNLACLIFISLNLRLIIENLMKYGLLFRISSLWHSDPDRETADSINRALAVAIPFIGIMCYITIISPLIAFCIERLTTPSYHLQDGPETGSSVTAAGAGEGSKSNGKGKSNKDQKTKREQVQHEQSTSVLNIQTSLILHIINLCCVFVIPLVYTWNTTVIPLVLRFPIGFVTVVTTLKLASYVHVSHDIHHSANSKIIVFDTKINKHDVKSYQQKSDLSDDVQQYHCSLNDITRETALTMPFCPAPPSAAPSATSATSAPPSAATLVHEDVQTNYIRKLQHEVLGAMNLYYSNALKLVHHSALMMSLENPTPSTQQKPSSQSTWFMSTMAYIKSWIWSDPHAVTSIITRQFGLFAPDDEHEYILHVEEPQHPESDHGKAKKAHGGSDSPVPLTPGALVSKPSRDNNNSNTISQRHARAARVSEAEELFDYSTPSSSLDANAAGAADDDDDSSDSRSFITTTTRYLENAFDSYYTNGLYFPFPQVGLLTRHLDDTKEKKDKNSKRSVSKNPLDVEPIEITYQNTSALSTHVYLKNLPPPPHTLPQYTIINYIPSLYHLVYFLISPTLIFQLSYPRNSRIKPLFLFRRCVELLFISFVGLFIIEQYVRPTLANSLNHFIQLESASQNIQHTLQHHAKEAVPRIMNSTFSSIKTHVSNTLNTIIDEETSSKLFSVTDLIANTILNTTTSTLSPSSSFPGLPVNSGEFPSPQVTASISESIRLLLFSCIAIVERTLKLSIPNLVIWLLIFYGLFHSYLNLVGELCQFADRTFYLSWWNAKDLGEYWNQWNIPVHIYFAKHLFAPLLRRKWSANSAKLFIFFISALLHEVVIAIPLHIVSAHAFFGMMFQVPMILISTFLRKRLNNPIIGNVIFWMMFIVVGQPILILLYGFQYFQTHGGLSN